ncbi:hypothetical protein [Marinomonas profundimaris]|uniref:Glycosyl transferase n=1 Tax=Marinomonas profundimaris TaxID=1208321 RepID=W1S0A5_9GAMM|nr:hypothetical protein [Marinomonas profundimaris]ETI61424.1 hypothetical protein D104_05730 [Marinomonas profundimaris]
MSKRIVNISSDSRYFSRLLNLIGSIRKTNDKLIFVEVWDLGLSKIQKEILNKMDVTVNRIDDFYEKWSDCYAWKIYVYKHSAGDVFFHLDAGNIVFSDVHHIFDLIEKDGFFLVDQGQRLEDITPKAYMNKYGGSNLDPDYEVFAAGNIGLNKKCPEIKAAIDDAYLAASNGACMGYSFSERNRDKKGSNIIHDCKLFRHDQTLFNVILRKHCSNLYIHRHENYAALKLSPESCIVNKRTYAYRNLIDVDLGFLLFPVIFYCFFSDIKIRAVNYISRRFK